LKNDEDQSDQHYLGFYQRIQTLANRAMEQSSYMTPEIMAIDETIMRGFLGAAELEPYGFYLEKILRNRPHTLSEQMEELLAMSRNVTQAPSQIFGQLDNVDLKFGFIKNERGQEVELSHGNFSTFLINQDRDIRKTAFFQYYKPYEEHKNTMAAALAGSIQVDLFHARARRY
jgi:oligoendopeptidase F